MRKSFAFYPAILVISLLFPVEAAAQWHAGADLGMVFDTFRTDYSYPIGTPDSFANHASGFEAGALFGYDWALNCALTLGLELRSATNSARWELDSDDVFSGTLKGGPSHLRYEIPWTIRAAGVIKIRLIPDLALTGELGMEWGAVRLNKTSATSTSYASTNWVPGLVAGAGLEWRLSGKLDLIARFAFAKYRDKSLNSRFPDGEIWETIAVRPSHLSGRLGILFRFS